MKVVVAPTNRGGGGSGGGSGGALGDIFQSVVRNLPATLVVGAAAGGLWLAGRGVMERTQACATRPVVLAPILAGKPLLRTLLPAERAQAATCLAHDIKLLELLEGLHMYEIYSPARFADVLRTAAAVAGHLALLRQRRLRVDGTTHVRMQVDLLGPLLDAIIRLQVALPHAPAAVRSGFGEIRDLIREYSKNKYEDTRRDASVFTMDAAVARYAAIQERVLQGVYGRSLAAAAAPTSVFAR